MNEEQRKILDKYDWLPFGHPDFFKFWSALREEEYEKNKAEGKEDPLDLVVYKGNPFKNLK